MTVSCYSARAFHHALFANSASFVLKMLYDVISQTVLSLEFLLNVLALK